MKFSTIFSMPNKYTFKIKPIYNFVAQYCAGKEIIVDPFSGTSQFANYSNDLGYGGIDAEDYCNNLLREGIKADVVIFDPPYSPRQISECYKSIGRKVTQKDTQNAALYSRVKKPLRELLKKDGIALSFGWNSIGLGKELETVEIMLVQHGAAHNDTICVAQKRKIC